MPGGSRKNEEKDAVNQLEVAERTARTYLMQCGNRVVEHEDTSVFMAEVLYILFNRKSSAEVPFSARAAEEIRKHITGEENIPISAFIMPKEMDFRRAGYSIIDGLYYANFMIPSDGYKPQVAAGWLSLLVNAGEGIDVDIFLNKEPKEKVQFQLGRQIRINRSKMKETSDTNTDFDDMDSAVRSGYYLKDGLANNQDFYYINTLITITADSQEELEWRTNEMKKLMLSQDLILKPCYFRQDLAFASVLPFNKLHKGLHELSKRNVLTTGAASCFPYVSFEMSDDNGILLGVNKYNNSLISIYGIPAVVIHGDSITVEEWSRWYTPAYAGFLSSRWELQQRYQRMILNFSVLSSACWKRIRKRSWRSFWRLCKLMGRITERE